MESLGSDVGSVILPQPTIGWECGRVYYGNGASRFSQPALSFPRFALIAAKFFQVLERELDIGAPVPVRRVLGRKTLPYPLVRTSVICRREVARAAATWVLVNSATGTFLPSRVEKRTRWPLSIFVWTL